MSFPKKKTFVCRDYLCTDIAHKAGRMPFKINSKSRVRCCNKGESCIGVHNLEDLTKTNNIIIFNKYDKIKLNTFDIYKNIIIVFDKNIKKIKEREKLNLMENYKNMNLIQLLHTWKELHLYYKCISRDIKNKKANNHTYNSNTIPSFALENETIVFELSRLTKFCDQYKKLEESLQNKDNTLTVWDVCCYDINCKNGCHHIEQMICSDDLLYGNCGCSTNRKMVHLTDEGLIPFYQLKEIEERPKVVCNETDNIILKVKNKIVKPYIRETY